MYLVNFMNAHSDWQTLLAQTPYCIDVRQDGQYYLLKYNMILSDFNEPMVQEARGSIFRQNTFGEWICVCRAMDKFGNYGESYAATTKIQWNRGVSVQEKIDGSIIKVWCDQGLWHTSTNGTIDAFKAECGDSTFGAIFYSIVEKYTTIRNFFEQLDPSYTYWFEMVHPLYNHIVVKYNEPAIYYLGCRNIVTMLESELSPTELFYGICTPKHFNYTSLAECIEAAHNMGVDEEGYVVCAYNQMENGSFLRIKIKGDEYLRLHKIRGNGVLTILRVIEMWQDESLDDFVAYYPEYNDFVAQVQNSLKYIIEIADLAFKTIMCYDDAQERRNFAQYTNIYLAILRPCLFSMYDGKVKNATEFYKKFRAKNIASTIANLKHITISAPSIGVEEI